MNQVGPFVISNEPERRLRFWPTAGTVLHMATPKVDPEVLAVQKVYEALKPLDSDGQQRVLSAALSLLGLAFNIPQSTSDPAPVPSHSMASGTSSPTRPKGLTEFVTEKKPATSAQRILLFAYYREKFENFSNFSIGDIRPYFAKAKLSPPGNFDRDFASAVEKGWIHHDGAKSYVTQKGVDLVDSNFSGARSYSDRPTEAKGKSRGTSAKKK